MFSKYLHIFRMSVLALLTGALLLSGCGRTPAPAPAPESASEDMTETAQTAETAAAVVEEVIKPSPETTKVGICLSRMAGGDNARLLKELQNTLPRHGFTVENLLVQRMTGSRTTQLKEIGECLAEGCGFLIVSPVSDRKIPEIADLAAEAGVGILFVNCDPGEEEISRWTQQGIDAVWLGTTYSEQLACQMNLLYTFSGTERGLDFNGDGEVGTLLIGGGEEARTRLGETLRDLGTKLRVLDEMEDGEAEEISLFTQEILNEYRKEAELVICSSEEALAAAADGVQLRHRLVGRDIIVIGTGTHEDTCTGIVNKLMSGSTFIDFYEQADLAAVAAKDMIEGNQQERVISNVLFKVTEENAQEVLDQLWNTREED